MIDQIADALAFAHQKGVVHRDVKPSNILLDKDGNALLADFGLAYIHDASVSLTGSALIGTPTYMSPEQALGDPVDQRSDLYSLGIIMYQMITGQVPFEAETPLAVLMKHMSEPVPLPRVINPQISEAIERVILKAIAKDPKERFVSVAEMNAAFQAAIAHTLNPGSEPAPLLEVPRSTATTQIYRASESALSKVRGNWAQISFLAAAILLSLLALPILASGFLGLLEEASSPAHGSGLSLPSLSPARLTALASTIEAIPQLVVATKVPTPSSEPTELVVIEEGFDQSTDAFPVGEGRMIDGGAYFLGPFEHCATDEAAFDIPVGCSAVCLTCGQDLTNYYLEVDFQFVEGLSEGGYGIMLRFVDVDSDGLLDRKHYLLAMGFNTFDNTWHVYVHRQDRVQAWYLVRDGPAGLRPVGHSNRLRVTTTRQGRHMDVNLNDFRIVILTADPPQPGETLVEDWADSGAVGFLALSRRVRAQYDNLFLQPLP